MKTNDQASEKSSAPVRLHPDLFTAEEAYQYLRLHSVESLRTLEQKDMLKAAVGLTRHKLYHREDLDECVRRMFGKLPTLVKLRSK